MTVTKIKEYAYMAAGFALLITPSILAHYAGRYVAAKIINAIANRKK